MKRSVSDVMSTPVVSVRPATSFKEMVRLLHHHQINALPVVDPDGRLLGIVSETDLALKQEEQQPSHRVPLFVGAARRRQRTKASGTTAADFMSGPVVTVLLGSSLDGAARLFHQHDVRHLPVVDPEGRLVGIVTQRDLLSVFLHADVDVSREITQAVLHRRFNLPAGAVQVEVREGVVTLSGRVPWRSTAGEIVAWVSALDGVVGVVDRLSWVHDGTVGAATTPGQSPQGTTAPSPLPCRGRDPVA
jgi:CBS-domain-containing membrane protein